LIESCPERVLTIRFEDFISHEKSVLHKICMFLGVKFDPQMLDVAHSTEARKISGLSALWESNASRPIPANVDKFRKLLSMEEIEIIETLTGPYMDSYGYERMTPGKARMAPELREQAQKRSQQKREAAWNTLRSANFRDYSLRRARADYIAMVKERLLREPLGTLANGGKIIQLALNEAARVDLD